MCFWRDCAWQALPHCSRATRPVGRSARNAIRSLRQERRFGISPVRAPLPFGTLVLFRPRALNRRCFPRGEGGVHSTSAAHTVSAYGMNDANPPQSRSTARDPERSFINSFDGRPFIDGKTADHPSANHLSD